MPKINYSYTFDEEFDRIYDCFTNAQINKDMAFSNLVSNLEFSKGERFDEENSEFSFIWKNYYSVKMIVQNVTKSHNFRTYMNKSIYIDKLPIQITIIYNYYWDTIEQKTILVLDLIYQDDFFKELIATDVNELDLSKACKNVENYLDGIIRGLEINNSFLLNCPIEELWKTISNLEVFFTISGKKLIPIFKDKEANLNSILEFYDSNDKELKPTILTKLIVDILFVSSNYIKLSIVTLKKLYFANHRITFIIKKLDNKKCMFTSKVRILEPCDHKLYLSIVRFWKKIMQTYYNNFESKQKKRSKKNLKIQ